MLLAQVEVRGQRVRLHEHSLCSRHERREVDGVGDVGEELGDGDGDLRYELHVPIETVSHASHLNRHFRLYGRIRHQHPLRLVS